MHAPSLAPLSPPAPRDPVRALAPRDLDALFDALLAASRPPANDTAHDSLCARPRHAVRIA